MNIELIKSELNAYLLTDNIESKNVTVDFEKRIARVEFNNGLSIKIGFYGDREIPNKLANLILKNPSLVQAAKK